MSRRLRAIAMWSPLGAFAALIAVVAGLATTGAFADNIDQSSIGARYAWGEMPPVPQRRRALERRLAPLDERGAAGLRVRLVDDMGRLPQELPGQTAPRRRRRTRWSAASSTGGRRRRAPRRQDARRSTRSFTPGTASSTAKWADPRLQPRRWRGARAGPLQTSWRRTGSTDGCRDARAMGFRWHRVRAGFVGPRRARPRRRRCAAGVREYKFGFKC